MDIEYGYVQVKNGKAIGISPKHAYTEIPFPLDLDIVLNRLVEANWEISAAPSDVSTEYKLRIARSTDHWHSYVGEADVRVASVDIQASEAEFDNVVAEIRHLWEVNGWNLIEIWRKGGLNFGPTLFFSKPKYAPDRQPFVDPNTK